jgi:hypothetical protein
MEDPDIIWPPVPERLRPKKLPYAGNWSEKYITALEQIGYAPVNILFLDGPEALKLTLEGIRLGTVVLTRTQLDALEVEARLYNNNAVSMEKETLLEENPEVLELMNRISRTKTITSRLPRLDKSKRGRPRKETEVRVKDIIDE